MASTSFSTVEYLVSLGKSFLLMSCPSNWLPSSPCSNTAQRPTPEASVCTVRGRVKCNTALNTGHFSSHWWHSHFLATTWPSLGLIGESYQSVQQSLMKSWEWVGDTSLPTPRMTIASSSCKAVGNRLYLTYLRMDISTTDHIAKVLGLSFGSVALLGIDDKTSTLDALKNISQMLHMILPSSTDQNRCRLLHSPLLLSKLHPPTSEMLLVLRANQTASFWIWTGYLEG